MLSIVTPSIVPVFIIRPVVIDQTIQKKYSRPHHGRQRRQWLIIHKCRHMEPSDLVSPYSIRFFCQGLHSCTKLRSPCSAIISLAQSAPMFNSKGQPVTEGSVHKPHVMALVLRAHEQWCNIRFSLQLSSFNRRITHNISSYASSSTPYHCQSLSRWVVRSFELA